jgi:PEP-CTERM motif
MSGRERRVRALLTAVVLIGALCAPAEAITTDIILGGIDSAKSGQAYEEAQLEALCNCSVTLLSNVDTSTFGTVGTQNFINVAPSTPGYFILKFGDPGFNDMFFFQNVGELNLLVWTNAQLLANGASGNHFSSISHYAITSNVAVPEPGTLALLGLGLASMGLIGRLRRKTI